MRIELTKVSELPDNVFLLVPDAASLFAFGQENQVSVHGICFAHPKSYLGVSRFVGATGCFEEKGVSVSFQVFEAREYARKLLRSDPLMFEIIAAAPEHHLVSTSEGNKFQELTSSVICRNLVVRYLAWAKAEITRIISNSISIARRQGTSDYSPSLRALFRATLNVAIATKLVAGDQVELPFSDGLLSQLGMMPAIDYENLGLIIQDLTKQISSLERSTQLRKMSRDPDRDTVEQVLMETLMDFLKRTFRYSDSAS